MHAVVTDANGVTAEATTEFHVILDLGGGSTGDILNRGGTYRVAGTLMTAPENHDIRVGGVQDQSCGKNSSGYRCNDNLNGYGLVGMDAGITLFEEDGELYRRRPQVSGFSRDPVRTAVDSPVDSLGKLPQREGG